MSTIFKIFLFTQAFLQGLPQCIDGYESFRHQAIPFIPTGAELFGDKAEPVLHLPDTGKPNRVNRMDAIG